MKYLGSRELTGFLDQNEEKILIENDLAGIGWKIRTSVGVQQFYEEKMKFTTCQGSVKLFIQDVVIKS